MVKDYEVVLAGFRKQFPQYADVPGETLINSLQQKYYSDLSIDEVAQAIAGKWGSPLDTSAKEADYSGTEPGGDQAEGRHAGLPQHAAAAASTFDVGSVGGERVGKGETDAQFLVEPLIPVSKWIREKLPEQMTDEQYAAFFSKSPLKVLPAKAQRAVFGAMMGTVQFAEGMTSPAMIAMVAATGGVGAAAAAPEAGVGIKALSTAISAGFAADMGVNAGRDAKAMALAMRNGNWEEAGERLAMTALGGAFAVGAGKHAYKTGRLAYADYKLQQMGFPAKASGELAKAIKNDELRITNEKNKTKVDQVDTGGEIGQKPAGQPQGIAPTKISKDTELRPDKARGESADILTEIELKRLNELQNIKVGANDVDLMITQLEKGVVYRGGQWTSSDLPSWYKKLSEGSGAERLESVVSRKDALAVLNKVKAGEKLTERQADIWGRIEANYKDYVWEGKQQAVGTEGETGTGPGPEVEQALWAEKNNVALTPEQKALLERYRAEAEPEHVASPWDEAGGDLFVEDKATGRRQYVDRETVARARGEKQPITNDPASGTGSLRITNEEFIAEHPGKDRSPVINEIRLQKTRETKSWADVAKINSADIVTIYRALPPGKKIVPGDFVAVDKEIARFYARDILRRTGKPVKIISKKVRADEVRLHPDHQVHGVNDEFIYNPKTADVWQGQALPVQTQEFASGRQIPQERFKMESQAGAGASPARTSRAQIREYLQKEFDVAIYKGAVGGGRKKSVMGQYGTFTETVFEKNWGDIYTEAHEVAHHIDKLQQITAKLKNYSAVLTEELGKLDYNYPKSKRVVEGFAEYVRHDMTIGDAGKQAPNFDRHFKQILENNPELKAKYETSREMYRTWFEQGAQERLHSNIDMDNKIGKLGWKEGVKHGWRFLVGKFQNDMYPVEAIVKEGMRAQEKRTGKKIAAWAERDDPFALYEDLKYTARARAEWAVMREQIDYVGRKVGESLSTILDPVKGKITDFIDYVVARRALVYAERGFESGIELKDAEWVFNKLDSPKFRAASDAFMQWADNALKYFVDAGGLSEEAYLAIRAANPFYAALKRVFEGERKRGIAGGGGGLVNQGNTVKSVKGGSEVIINPLEGMIGEVHKLYLAADKVRVARALSNLTEIEGMGRLMTEVSAPVEAKSFTLKDIKKQLDEAGVDLADADMDAMLTVFSQGWEYKGNRNIISIWKDGQRHFYQLNRELYNALMGMEPKKLNPFFDLVLGKPARMVRLMTTGINASFGLVRNPMRDIMTAMVYSKGSAAMSPVRSIKGVVSDVTGKPGANMFRSLGGEMATLMGQDRMSLMRTIDMMLLDNGTLKGRVLQVVKHPIDALRKVTQISELGPRVGEFEMMMEKGWKAWQEKNPGKSKDEWKETTDYENVVIRSFNAGRDLTINFSKNGTYGAVLNQIIPFWNASIQSSEKMLRAFKERPVAMTARSIVGITAPSVILWAINKDKEWYKSLPLAYKYNNWFIEVDDKTIIRIPKPFELGAIFGGFIEGALDQSADIDDGAVSAAAGLMVANMTPDVLPASLQPAYQVLRNKDWLGRSIETAWMQRMLKRERYRETTSDLAKYVTIGMEKIVPEGFVLSPVQWDHLLNGYTGGAWNTVKRANRLGRPGEMQKSDIPVAGTVFLRTGGQPAREVNNAYNVSRLVEEAHATFKMYLKRGDKETARGILARNPAIRKYSAIKGHREKITELLKLRRAYEKDAARVAEIDKRIRQHAAAVMELYKEKL